MADHRITIEPYFELIRAQDPPPRRFQVVGERASGTNLADTLLRRNISAKVGEGLGWKHGFPHALAIPSDYLVVGVVRNALSWALSMYGRPWHAAADLQRMGFSEFIRAPWDSVIDRARYFGMEPGDPRIGQPLQLDRHPLTGERFANLMALRNAKMAALLGLRNRGCNLVLVQLEQILANTGGFIDQIASTFGLKKAAELTLVERRLGQRFKAAVPERPVPPENIDENDRAFLIGQLDAAQEAAIGYHYAP